MRRCCHPLFALLLSLLLLSGQQAALAHMLGHATTTATVQGAAQVATHGDADHGATLALSHVCTTCLAFAGVDAAPPASILSLALAPRPTVSPLVAVPPAPTLRFIAAFRSRAPPSL